MSDSKKIDDGGFAFPSQPDADACGMSLRDWFAGQAINGICAGLCADASNDYAPNAFSRVGITEAAKDAYLIADAMIAARKGGA